MKNFILFAALLCSVALIQSCDPDEDVCEKTCVNGEVNLEFCDCECDAGFLLDSTGDCTIEIREQFVGTYPGEEQCDGDPQPFLYTLTISRDDADAEQVKILNFFNSFASTPVFARVSTLNDGSLTIDKQTPAVGGDISVEGTAQLVGDSLYLDYVAVNATTLDTFRCATGVFVKQ